MRLTAKIDRVSKTKHNGTYRLRIVIKDVVADTAKLSSKIKGKKIAISREFSKLSPPPKIGELIVLDRFETDAVLKKLQKIAKTPKSPSGETILVFGDTDREG